MENESQAQWLIDNVSGKVPQGLSAPVIIKKKYTRQWGGDGGKGGFGGIPPWAMMQMMQWYKGKGKGKGWGGRRGLASFDADKKVWIGNLPEEEGLTFQELQAHFPGCKFASVMKGKGAGTGGVAFETAEEATAALAKNGSVLKVATLVVDVWTKKDPAADPQPAA